jgi:predicted dehydrogenase
VKKKINLAIVGLGHWGRNYLRIFEGIKNVNIKKICDLNNSKFKNRNDFTSNFNEILNDKNINAIVISTIAKTHYILAKKALEKGKHVLIEKPITLNLNHAKILKKLSDKNKCTLMVGHTFLYNQSVIKLKQILKKKIAGEIYYINCRRTHLGLIRDDVDAIWDLAPHDISILNYIINKKPKNGKLKKVKCLNKKRADAAFIHLEYPANIIANIHVSWVDSNKSRLVEIIGSKARILFDDLNQLEPIKIFLKGVSVEKNNNNDAFFYNLRDGDILSPKVNLKEPLYEMCVDFINSILNKRNPTSGFKVGYECIKILKSLKEM